MTEKELNKTSLLGSVKNRILEIALHNHKSNGTPLNDGIRLAYNAYTKPSKG